MSGYHYECAKGYGMVLEPWWCFCPYCGQSFGGGNFGKVRDSRRARDGKVRKVTHAPAPSLSDAPEGGDTNTKEETTP